MQKCKMMISNIFSRSSAKLFAGLVCATVLVVGTIGSANAIETKAREAFLIDQGTGTVLLGKNADVPMPPASMSKIMTVFMIFEALREGKLTLETRLPVSEKAWRMGGSKMFVEVGDEIRVEDLLRGVIVQSGNDACIVLAEGLAGSEEAFADLMTKRAAELGMNESIFANSTGWPNPNHRTSARDLAKLAGMIIEDYPEYYTFFAEKEFVWSDIRQGNRNPLLYKNIGADGLKTGHTQEAGYGLTASAQQGDRRLILVINGLDSVKARSSEATKLLTWGFRQFNNYALFSAGEEVESAAVWLGEEDEVSLVAEDDIVITLNRDDRKDMEVKVSYDAPVPAPIVAGTKIAELRISAPGLEEDHVVPLVAANDVGRLGAFGRILASVEYLIFGEP